MRNIITKKNPYVRYRTYPKIPKIIVWKQTFVHNFRHASNLSENKHNGDSKLVLIRLIFIVRYCRSKEAADFLFCLCVNRLTVGT